MPLHDASSAAVPAWPSDRVVLQTLTLPDPALCADPALFVTADAAVQIDNGTVVLPPGASVDFGTWVNLLNLDTWTGHCLLDGLALHLAGTGAVVLDLTQIVGQQDRPLLHQALTLTPQGTLIDLTAALATGGIILLKLHSQDGARLQAGAWLTRPPQQTSDIRLAIGITTFRREAEVSATARRCADWFAARTTPDCHLFIIDNGQSLTLPPYRHVTVIANRNLGGAGGFARALAAASDGGFSHCLFMDDDASFPMENLRRTLAFLRLARSPRAALAGAMLSTARPDLMWENGSVFDRLCRPQFGGTDLTDRAAVLAMEQASAAPKPPGFYGGWWYFAFPVAAVRFWPFPFFVRGDDISFSLANRFDTATLNGVMSLQEDFGRKESPQTLYLDLRNHLHHHLTQPDLDIGPRRSALMALRFILRALVRMHYESAAIQCLAWEDVMTGGPAHFTDNADMAAKRAEIADQVRIERWTNQTGSGAFPPSPSRKPSALYSHLMRSSLNGHLIPFWRHLGRTVRIDITERALIWPLWGAAAAVFTDNSPDLPASRNYAVHHDKRAFFRIIGRALKLTLRWQRAYPGLVTACRKTYPDIAARAFWDQQFSSGPISAPRPQAAAVSAGKATQGSR